MVNALEKSELRLMMLVANHKDVKIATDILELHGIPVQFLCRGEGSASSKLLVYLGLDTAEKAIFMCVVPKNQVPELFDSFEIELNLRKPGHGIVFTFPVSGVSSFLMNLLCSEVHQNNMDNFERGEYQMSSEYKHSFLMAIVDQGYNEEVMDAAREAGATGGTVLHARRIGSEETIKKWGISIQPEKEIVFILTEKEKKHDIMSAIGEKCGCNTDAHGIVISIPVDAVAGLADSKNGHVGFHAHML